MMDSAETSNGPATAQHRPSIGEASGQHQPSIGEARSDKMRAVAEKRKLKPRAGDKKFGRSAITNQTRLLAGVPNTDAWSRRALDIISEHVADLGGEGNISAAEYSIIRCAAALKVELEALEAKFATGKSDKGDVDLYIRGAGGLRRLLQSLGLERRAKNVGPTVEEYLASKRREAST
jgi:hypothetical protein